jgi:hypothetical protein
MGVGRVGVRPGRSSDAERGARTGLSGKIAARCRPEVGVDPDRRGPTVSGREKGKESRAGGTNWAGRKLGHERKFGLW